MSERSVNDIPDSELVRRVIRSIACKSSRRPLWARVMESFGLGSTFSFELCVKHGFNPEQTKYKEPQYGLASPTQARREQ